MCEPREVRFMAAPAEPLPPTPEMYRLGADSIRKKRLELGLGNSRAWSVIIYPHYTKAQIDWLLSEVLTMRGMSGALSPLHDSDYYEEGSGRQGLKDPHYHLMIRGNKAINADLALAVDYCLNGNFAPVVPVQCELKMYYYHIHLYDPDKSLYSDEERTLYNGYVPPAKDSILEQLFTAADMCSNLHELTVYCRAERIDLIPYIERYFRTLKAFYNEHY